MKPEQHPSRPSSLADALALCAVDQTVCGAVLLSSDVDADAVDKGAWLQVAPRGRVATRDGRTFSFDPEKLVARFKADGIDIPVDLDHAVALRARHGETARAIGWIKELEARPEGVFARIEWLDGGREVLAARTHRFVSPTFRHTQTGEAVWLHSVALVAAPALSLPAVASAETLQDPPQELPMKSVLSALGLSEAADEASSLAAITTLKENSVDKAVHDEALATLTARTEELAALKAAVRSEEVDALIEDALKAKKIVPAQRDHYAALCATDEGLAGVKKLLDATPETLAASGLDTRKPSDGGPLDPVTLAAAARELVAESRAKGVELSIADAVNKVKENRS